MIREIAQSSQMGQILSGRPFFEGCIQTAYMCYRDHPSLARFYVVDKCAVLLLTGDSALLCGDVQNSEELSSFLHFSGVKRLKTDGVVPSGYNAQGLVLMQYSSEIEYLPPRGVELDINPNMRKLVNSPCLAYGNKSMDEFYSDACARRLRGLAEIWALSEHGEYVATAGVYSIQKNEVYIAAVGTEYECRGKGYASYLVWNLAERYTGRRVVLLCEDKMRVFYERLGFCKLSNIIQCKKETDNATTLF